MADTVNTSIVAHFQTLEDPRIERTKKHNLLDSLVIALCTLLSGGEGFQDMELFGKSKRAWLQTFLSSRTKIFLCVKILLTFADARPCLFYSTAQQEGPAYRCDLFKI
jgi:DDE_Tnp_1-associated